MLTLLLLYLFSFASTAKLTEPDCGLRTTGAETLDRTRIPYPHSFSKEDSLEGGRPANVKVAVQHPDKLRLNVAYVEYPLSAVGYVTSSVSGGCHGQLVNYCTVAIASHCIKDKKGKLAEKLMITTSDGKERPLLNPEAPDWMTYRKENGKDIEVYHPDKDVAFVQIDRKDGELQWPGESLGTFQVPYFGPNDLNRGGEKYCNFGKIHDREGMTDNPNIDVDIKFYGRSVVPGSPDNYVGHNTNGGRGASGSGFFICDPKTETKTVGDKKVKELVSLGLKIEWNNRKKVSEPVAVMIGIFTNVNEELNDKLNKLKRPMTDQEANDPKNRSHAILNNAYIDRLIPYLKNNPCNRLPSTKVMASK
ncbi:MAG: hypothetical protein AB7O96_01345 [Pseudobdellovibrionaceae bacterium]